MDIAIILLLALGAWVAMVVQLKVLIWAWRWLFGRRNKREPRWDDHLKRPDVTPWVPPSSPPSENNEA